MNVICPGENFQRVVPMTAGFECRLPGGFVLVGQDVVIQLAKQCERWNLKLPKRRRRIVEGTRAG